MEYINSYKTKVIVIISYRRVNISNRFTTAGSEFMMDNIIWNIQKTKFS